MSGVQRTGTTPQTHTTAAQSSQTPSNSLAALPAKQQALREALNQNVPKGDNEAIQARLRDVYAVLNSLTPDEAEALHRELKDGGSDLGKLFHYKLSTPTRQAMLDKLDFLSMGQRVQTRWEQRNGQGTDTIDLEGKEKTPLPRPKAPADDELSPELKKEYERRHKELMKTLRDLRA